MSVHRSLKSKSRLARARSVLTREERIARLEEEEKWQEGQSVFGLPKVRTLRPKVRKRGKKKEEEEQAAEAPAAKK